MATIIAFSIQDERLSRHLEPMIRNFGPLASFIGTILWMVQNMLTPVTRKYCSQTWHYYTGLVPVFFLLGGSEIISRLFSFIAPAHRAASPVPGSVAIVET
ncbi:hypothetical protein NYE70_01460 [Paenibacillus sp. FSL R5-0407]|uniref:hypothetical protein n=1 Tax=Paenibacillus TaxID=44249 RepID=UPI0025B7333D|nr:hypothetical protein [Paenibacillus vini]MDN4069367.1 hypothetical protein [Paenibacillus vini]